MLAAYSVSSNLADTHFCNVLGTPYSECETHGAAGLLYFAIEQVMDDAVRA